MICAIELLAMAHQWRKHFAPMIRMRLRINPWRNGRAIGFLLTAHQLRMTAQYCPSHWRHALGRTADGRTRDDFDDETEFGMEEIMVGIEHATIADVTAHLAHEGRRVRAEYLRFLSLGASCGRPRGAFRVVGAPVVRSPEGTTQTRLRTGAPLHLSPSQRNATTSPGWLRGRGGELP